MTKNITMYDGKWQRVFTPNHSRDNSRGIYLLTVIVFLVIKAILFLKTWNDVEKYEKIAYTQPRAV